MSYRVARNAHLLSYLEEKGSIGPCALVKSVLPQPDAQTILTNLHCQPYLVICPVFVVENDADFKDNESMSGKPTRPDCAEISPPFRVLCIISPVYLVAAEKWRKFIWRS